METPPESVRKIRTGLDHLQHVNVNKFSLYLFMLLQNLSSVDCGLLPDPDNGTVMLTGTHVGSKATYSCDPGYSRVGDATVVCQSNVNWSGTATCIGIIYIMKFSEYV